MSEMFAAAASSRDAAGIVPARGAAIAGELAIVAAMTAVFIFLWGYRFGQDDHAIHLAFIERLRDSAFLPGDPMLEIAAQHPSMFFGLIAGLSRLWSVEAIYFGLHVLSTFALMYGVRALGRSLWPGFGASWLFALGLAAAMLIPRSVAGGISNYDPLLLPRVLSLGPLLIALALCARGRPLTAFALTGVVFLFHATTAAHTAALIWMACAFCGRERLRALWLGPLVFLLAASPLLASMFASGGGGIPTPAPPEWIEGVKLHYPFHHFDRLSAVVLHTLLNALAILAAVLCSPWKGAGRMLAGFFVGGLTLLVAGAVGNHLLSSPHTIQLHLFQVGRMLDYIALLCALWCAYTFQRRSRPLGAVALLAAVIYVFSTLICALSGTPSTPQLDIAVLSVLGVLLACLTMVAVVRAKHGPVPVPAPRPAPRPRITIALCALIVGATVVTGTQIADATAHWDYRGTRQPGYTMMRWADGALPADAVVMIPPYLYQPVVAFRYFGRRSIVGSWKDGGEGTFDYAFQMRWTEFMRDAYVLPATIDPLEHPQLLERVIEDYHRMPAARLVELAEKYGASHIVRQATAAPLALPQLYRDEDYAVYRVAPLP